uniref:Uncharacterized protein n=1 Tax=Zea mays TaxID=4577 RepID=C4J728_MAIZE|nr:unknown [Zea mays]
MIGYHLLNRSSLLRTSPAGATPDQPFLALKCRGLLTCKDNKMHCFCVVVP